jgi:hypothetical protein
LGGFTIKDKFLIYMEEMVMSKKAVSVIVYGIYYLLAGLTYLVMPAFSLSLFGFPVEGTLNLRIAGILLGLHGYVYIQAARQELEPFFRWTVHIRIAAFALFGALVILGLAPPMLVLFGVVDLVGAIWTWSVSRQSG